MRSPILMRSVLNVADRRHRKPFRRECLYVARWHAYVDKR